MIRKTILSIFIFMLAALFTGCGRENSDQSSAAQNYESGYGSAKMEDDTGSVMEQEIMDGTDTETIVLSSEVMQLENGLSAVEYRGNDGFDAFISQGALLLMRRWLLFWQENYSPAKKKSASGECLLAAVPCL